MMIVGYPNDHHGDCYTMYNFDTRRRCESRDIRWLDRMYFAPDGTAILKDPLVTLERSAGDTDRIDGNVSLDNGSMLTITDGFEDEVVSDDVIYLGENSGVLDAAPADAAPAEDVSECRSPVLKRIQ